MPALMMSTTELLETAYPFWDAFPRNVTLMSNVELEEVVSMVLARTRHAVHPVNVTVIENVITENAGILAITPRIALTMHRVISANMDYACAREVCAKRHVHGFTDLKAMNGYHMSLSIQSIVSKLNLSL